MVQNHEDYVKIERIPIANRIARLLQEKIEGNEYRPGEWLPTERELATEFNADRATIRAAIAYLAEQRLVVREPGRRPWVNIGVGQPAPPQKQSSKPASLQTIAAILPQPPTYPALSVIQRGILRVLRQKKVNYRLIVFDNQGEVWSQSVVLEKHALGVVEHEGIAGAVLWSLGGKETLPDIERVQEQGIPLVLLDRYPEDFPCDFVGVDNRIAARDAVNYLLDLGHRRIAHITSDKSILTTRERKEGYLDALLARGIPPAPELIVHIEDRDGLYPKLGPAVDYLFSLPEPPTALFTLKDLLAHAFIQEANVRGLRVPEDISVIGFDDQDRYSLQTPSLTTVYQPFEEMGQRAAELLLRRLANPGATKVAYQHLFLPAPLVVRSTCQRHHLN